jgi:tRNA modification GTPase
VNGDVTTSGPKAQSADSLRATLLTPRGRGAVAVVRVWGASATSVVERMFAPAAGGSLEKFALGRIVFGRWHGAIDHSPDAAKTGEELVVCRRDVDDLEIHCHGGAAASTAILGALEAAGCAIVPWTEWSAERAVDLVQSEAERALAEARTARTAGILLDQYAGALSCAAEAIATKLAGGDTEEARHSLQTLLARSAVGFHLTTPFQVVLAGRPNVGKSSLINALVGYQRSIVFDQPGTTRDVVTAPTVFAGWPVELSDTAGLRNSTDLLETAGMNAARRRLVEADVVVLVFDTTAPWTSYDEALRAENPTAILAHNKIDRLTAPDANAELAARPPGLALSAATGRGVEELIVAITNRLVPNPPEPGEAVPFTERQATQLFVADEALTRGDATAARTALDQLAGTR